MGLFTPHPITCWFQGLSVALMQVAHDNPSPGFTGLRTEQSIWHWTPVTSWPPPPKLALDYPCGELQFENQWSESNLSIASDI